MFAPFRMRALQVENPRRGIAVAMYSATDGTPNDFHFVHYGERAMGGAGLVSPEMTCVSPEARISPGCTGMWNDEHVAAGERIAASRLSPLRFSTSASLIASSSASLVPEPIEKWAVCAASREG